MGFLFFAPDDSRLTPHDLRLRMTLSSMPACRRHGAMFTRRSLGVGRFTRSEPLDLRSLGVGGWRRWALCVVLVAIER
jgi:hypothetical protein